MASNVAGIRAAIASRAEFLRGAGLLARASLTTNHGQDDAVTTTGVELFVMDDDPEVPAEIDDPSKGVVVWHFGHLDVAPERDVVELGGIQYTVRTVAGPRGGDGRRVLTKARLVQ